MSMLKSITIRIPRPASEWVYWGPQKRDHGNRAKIVETLLTPDWKSATKFQEAVVASSVIWLSLQDGVQRSGYSLPNWFECWKPVKKNSVVTVDLIPPGPRQG